MGYRILLADDEEEVRRYFGQALKVAGFSVVFASNGDDAWDILKSGKVDLAVLDINMPGKDGFSILRWLRQEAKSRLPVVILSGFGELDRIKQGYNLETNHYITKPCSRSEFVKSIKAILSVKTLSDKNED